MPFLMSGSVCALCIVRAVRESALLLLLPPTLDTLPGSAHREPFTMMVARAALCLCAVRADRHQKLSPGAISHKLGTRIVSKSPSWRESCLPKLCQLDHALLETSSLLSAPLLLCHHLDRFTSEREREREKSKRKQQQPQTSAAISDLDLLSSCS